MTTSVAWSDILVASGTLIVTGLFAVLIKNFMYKYRRPNGKKGGVISFHAVIGFAIVTVVAMTTKDWFITGLAVILGYLIARGRLDEGQHYMYQIVLSAVIGIGMPVGLYYLYYKRLQSSDSDYSYEREEYDDKPDHARDERYEADEAPELRLVDKDSDPDDLDDLDLDK